MMWQNLLCWLTAGQFTAGRAAGYDVAKFAVRADCGPSYCGVGRGFFYLLRMYLYSSHTYLNSSHAYTNSNSMSSSSLLISCYIVAASI